MVLNNILMVRLSLLSVGLSLSFQTSVFGQEKLAIVDHRENVWYKDCIIYNLEIGVFQDSDGDGRGDFNGVISRLDYLKSLGVDVIWLAPFQPSPGKDDGYDVADYYGVDEKLGSSGDFAELMHQCRKRGVRVIMDLVINHTSDQHPWFQNARQSTNARYRKWYVWNRKRPADYNKGMVFPGVQETVWSLEKTTGQYYYHRFYAFQPDLDFRNQEVVRECQRIIGYWLNQGIAGFRLDAVPFIIEVPETGSEKPVLDFRFLMDIGRFAQSRKADVAILGEANVMPDENRSYFGEQGDGIQMMFNFYANQYLFYALATGKLQPFIDAMKETQQIPKASPWAYFLRSHDEIDLGRLSDKQRKEVYDAFGPDTSMQLYKRGIRRRLAPMLSNDRKRIELAYSLLFSLPGTPVIRYGDEIGMGDDLRQKERLSVRTPMQWSAAKNGGFTTADSAFRPVITGGTYGYESLNVSAQSKDPSSLLNWTANLIRVRKLCPEIGMGDYELIDTGTPDVLGIRYYYEGRQVITLHNFSREKRRATLKVSNAKIFSDLLPARQDLNGNNGTFTVELPGSAYRWYRVGERLPAFGQNSAK